MQVQPVNNTNFGARIIGNQYMRQEARYIAKNGSIEDKTRLFNFLNVIKNDTSFDTFEMRPKTSYDYRLDKLCEYIFILNNGEKVYKEEPFINNSLDWSGIGSDEWFLSELGSFIKKHYGKRVYNSAYKSKPKYVQKYLAALENAHKQLKSDIRDTLDLEPLNYDYLRNGKKIPTTSLGLPDNDYVC